ncbi:MAG: hypothetical protein JKY09_03575 [Crocinitomicaceae bacterium]|nr:hypothetical protein [Crocinitomicaceae bacterium]
MTSEEARFYFSDLEENELTDQYEQKLFEFKQFFLSKVPIEKLFRGRLKKIQSIDQAYVVLGGENENKEGFTPVSLEESEDLETVYTDYQLKKNVLKKSISEAASGWRLIEVIENYIELTRQYAKHWERTDISVGNSVVSAEPDPMEIHQAIQEFKKNGGRSFIDVHKLDDTNILVKESKRLSLWLKLDVDV